MDAKLATIESYDDGAAKHRIAVNVSPNKQERSKDQKDNLASLSAPRKRGRPRKGTKGIESSRTHKRPTLSTIKQPRSSPNKKVSKVHQLETQRRQRMVSYYNHNVKASSFSEAFDKKRQYNLTAQETYYTR